MDLMLHFIGRGQSFTKRLEMEIDTLGLHLNIYCGSGWALI
jgi:hypothetical protein